MRHKEEPAPMLSLAGFKNDLPRRLGPVRMPPLPLVEHGREAVWVRRLGALAGRRRD